MRMTTLSKNTRNRTPTGTPTRGKSDRPRKINRRRLPRFYPVRADDRVTGDEAPGIKQRREGNYLLAWNVLRGSEINMKLLDISWCFNKMPA